MPWVYRIDEISTTASGSTFVGVNIWRTRAAEARGDPPNFESVQLMNLLPVRQRAVTNDDGYFLRESGVYASPGARGNPDDPTVTEEYDVDVVAEMEGYIKSYILMKVKTGAHDNRGGAPTTISRDNSDPRGLLARSDMIAAKGRKREFTP